LGHATESNLVHTGNLGLLSIAHLVPFHRKANGRRSLSVAPTAMQNDRDTHDIAWRLVMSLGLIRFDGMAVLLIDTDLPFQNSTNGPTPYWLRPAPVPTAMQKVNPMQAIPASGKYPDGPFQDHRLQELPRMPTNLLPSHAATRHELGAPQPTA
jgi:hypothetical protein